MANVHDSGAVVPYPAPVWTPKPSEAQGVRAEWDRKQKGGGSK